jgi:hypothetical protein
VFIFLFAMLGLSGFCIFSSVLKFFIETPFGCREKVKEIIRKHN